MKESLPRVPGKHILACCDCVVHSELQVGARLIKNSMTYFTFIFPLGGWWSKRMFIKEHRTQQVEIQISSQYHLDFQEFLEVLPFGYKAPWLYEFFAKFISSS